MSAASEPQLNFEQLRWRTVLWLCIVGSLGMVPLILSGKDLHWDTIGSLVILSISLAVMAIVQALLRRPSRAIETFGLLIGIAVYTSRFLRIVRDVNARALPPEALADIFPWAAVLYGAVFIILPFGFALLASLLLWLAISGIGFGILARSSAIRGFEPSVDLMVSGAAMIIILAVFRRLIESGAKAQARAETMQELATRDSLTGLYNRHYLDEKLADEFNRASRYGHPLSLAICDIDFFKSINDTFTHEVGDETLKRLARLIESNVRITDIVARYGGEEFVIVFIETPIARAIGVCEALCQAISSHDWSSIHPKLNVTVSIGVAGNDQVIRYEKLLHEADIKLYEAKHQGKNRVCY